jgi:S-formylglutathione hydrolase FrmB/endo-alpha-1,4-polygalactosaminidase (GH114 family)
MRSPSGKISAAVCVSLVLTALGGTAQALAGDGVAGQLELTGRTKVDPRLIQLDFDTPAIAGGTGARVLLPPGYRDSGRDYPVLYLFHGAGYDETSWSTEGEVERIVGNRKLIVVMPRGGGNGYYSDWYNAGDFGPPAYETFHVRQLVPFIDKHFRTRKRRSGRIIAGFSMGGFGAMSYAARHPGEFSGAFSFSGAINTDYPPFQPIGEASSLEDTGEYAAIWGPRQTEEVRWRARNPFDLAPNLRGMTLQLRTGNGMGGGPFGGKPFDPIEFGVHEMATQMDRKLTGLGIPHLFQDYGPGAHEFPYYRRDLTRSLPAMMASFRNPPKPPRRFTFRAAEPDYTAYGYRVRLDRPELEFSELRGSTRRARRFTLTGSGLAKIRTPARLRPHRRYEVRTAVDGERRVRTVRSDGRGRMRMTIDLGESSPFQEYTAESEAAGGAIVHRAVVRIHRTPRRHGSPSRRERAAPQLWHPRPDDRYQYQLEGGKRSMAASGGIDVGICHVPFTGGPCVRPDAFDIDLYEDGRVAGKEGVPNTTAVDAIHDRGAHAVCYLSAGTAEKFRPDYEKYVHFDKRHGGRLLGKPFSDRFSNENWLDIGKKVNRRFVLSRMRKRTAKCAKAGFDAVEYDVVDAYAQGRKVTGFRISPKAQLKYDRSLARIAHDDGLAVGLKNDLGQLKKLEPDFDFAVNEQCLQYHECTNNPPPGYRAFLDAGKAVFQVEYRQQPDEFCPEANKIGLSSIKKAGNFSLNADPWVPCR